MLINGQLVRFGKEFERALFGSLELDAGTIDALPVARQRDISRLTVGLLLYHFTTFHRRVRVPLMRFIDWAGPRQPLLAYSCPSWSLVSLARPSKLPGNFLG